MWFPRRFLGSGCVFVEAKRCLHAQPQLTPVCWQEKARGRGALFAQLLHYDVLINNQKMNNTPQAIAVSVAKLCLSCLPQPQAVMEQMLLAAGREFPSPLAPTSPPAPSSCGSGLGRSSPSPLDAPCPSRAWQLQCGMETALLGCSNSSAQLLRVLCV